MSEKQWQAVDSYLSCLLAPSDAALSLALEASSAAGLPAISVTATQGKLLHLLAQMKNARNILEIGTLGGYSTIWLARALPSDGKLISLEISDKHAEVARKNIERAGLTNIVEVRVGKALDLLPKLSRESYEPFDLIFIDADKQNNPSYVQWAIKLSKSGSIIIVDNVVRKGAVLDADSNDPSIKGTRAVLELIAQEPCLDATAIQTVGSKGYDGFAIALVK